MINHYEAEEKVLAFVTEITGVSRLELMESSRRPRGVKARAICSYVMRQLGFSYPEIGRILSRDHTTIISLVRNFDRHGYLSEIEGAMWLAFPSIGPGMANPVHELYPSSSTEKGGLCTDGAQKQSRAGHTERTNPQPDAANVDNPNNNKISSSPSDSSLKAGTSAEEKTAVAREAPCWGKPADWQEMTISDGIISHEFWNGECVYCGMKQIQ